MQRKPENSSRSNVGQCWRLLILILAPLIIAWGMLFLRLTRPESYNHLMAEDGPIETGQFIAFALSGILALLTALRSKSLEYAYRLPLSAWGVILLLVALEEISWGQRFFALETPPFLAQHNMQSEINIHNLGVFQKDIEGAPISLLSLLPSLAGTLLALLALFPKRGARAFDKLLPSRALFFYFALMPFFFFAYGYCLSCLPWPNPEPRDQEFFELIFAIGILLWMLGCRTDTAGTAALPA